MQHTTIMWVHVVARRWTVATMLVAGGILASAAIGSEAPADGSDAHPLVMWGRDTSVSYPEADVPVTFDGITGRNIRWKTRLPNWSNSPGPILSNGRIFLMAEPWQPKGYSPWLLCIDAETGEELWRRELDAVEGFPEAERAEARRLAQEHWFSLYESFDQWYAAYSLWKSRPEGAPWPPPDPTPEEQAVLDRLDGRWNRVADLKLKKRCWNGYEHYRKKCWVKKKHNKEVRELGLGVDQWRGSGAQEGIGFMPPCSDGERVYAATRHHYFVCYTHDGELVWRRRFAPMTAADLPERWRERAAQYKKTVGREWYTHEGQRGNSNTGPVLVRIDDRPVLVWSGNSRALALDGLTGEQLWMIPCRSTAGDFRFPMCAKVDGEWILLLNDRFRSEAIRIRDGAIVGEMPGAAPVWGVLWDDTIVLRDTTVDRKHRQVIAVRLRWNADRTEIVTTEVWRASRMSISGGFARQDGLYYHHYGVYDLRTGRSHHGYRAKPCKGSGRPITFATGTAVGMVNWGRADTFHEHYPGTPEDTLCGEFVFVDRKTGKFLGVGMLPRMPEGGAPEKQILHQDHIPYWAWLGFNLPCAEGHRLYIRTYDYLWCIAPPELGTAASDPAVVAAIRGADNRAAVTPYLDDDCAQYRYEAVKRLGALGTDAATAEALRAIAVDDPSEWMRAAALVAWDRVQPGAGSGWLSDQLASHGTDSSRNFPVPLFLTLRRLPSGMVEKLLLALLDNDLQERRLAGVGVIRTTRFATPALEATLTRRLAEDPEDAVRAACVGALRDLEVASSAVRDLFLKRLDEEASAGIRLDCGFALAERWLHEAAVRKRLATFLVADEDMREHDGASLLRRVVDAIPEADGRALLYEVLTARRHHMRQAAAEILFEARPTPPEALRAFLALEERHPWNALRSVAPSEALAAILIPALEKPDLAVPAAGWLLTWRQGGESEALAALAARWPADDEDGADRLRSKILMEIVKGGSRLTEAAHRAQALELMTAWLPHMEGQPDHVSSRFLRNLGDFGPEASGCVPALDRLAQSQDKPLAKNAKQALKAIQARQD